MSEIEEPGGPAEPPEPGVPGRVIGTPSPTPASIDVQEKPAQPPLVTDPPDRPHAQRAETLVAALFVLAFIAGCGFIAAYIGLEVGSATIPKGANPVVSELRSNMPRGSALAAA